MYYFQSFPTEPAGVRLPYHQATSSQRLLALAHLQQRLAQHFPTLRANTWALALADYQPDLWLVGPEVVLAELDMRQLVQHLAASPELPLLDPPIFGLPALHLAQHLLKTSELAVWALSEVVATTACGPQLCALLRHLVRPVPLAEQVVQAWCWNLPSAPPLPPGLPDGRPAPSDAEVEAWLARLEQVHSSPSTLPGQRHHYSM